MRGLTQAEREVLEIGRDGVSVEPGAHRPSTDAEIRAGVLLEQQGRVKRVELYDPYLHMVCLFRVPTEAGLEALRIDAVLRTKVIA